MPEGHPGRSPCPGRARASPSSSGAQLARHLLRGRSLVHRGGRHCARRPGSVESRRHRACHRTAPTLSQSLFAPQHRRFLARRIRMLRTAMGPEIAATLRTRGGRMLLNRMARSGSTGLAQARSPNRPPPAPKADNWSLSRLMAPVTAPGACRPAHPSAELRTGERFEGIASPPVVGQVRAQARWARSSLTLAESPTASLPRAQAEFLRHAVRERKTSWSRAAPAPARPRSPMRCWPESPDAGDRVLVWKTRSRLRCPLG